jgi:transcriptional regulator with XRE-family HTH domain
MKAEHHVGTDDPPTIGERLKHIRKAAKLTQAEIAVLLDTHQGYVSDVERGAKTPGRILLERWVEVCDRRLDMVFSRADSVPLDQVTHYLDTMPAEHAVLVMQLARVLALTDDETRKTLARMLADMVSLAEAKKP